MNQVIKVKQKPIITYDLLKKISEEVVTKIESLDIDTLEPTENNLTLAKNIRAELNNDFKTLEDQRKMVKEIVLKDYNIFEDEYKRLIAKQFEGADAKLKSIVDTVTDKILKQKIDGIVAYFDEVNEYDFIKFDDLGLHIIKTKTDKAIKSEIDLYLSGIKTSIETIETLPNKDRVLAKFHIYKDMSRSISEVNVEMQREEQIKKQQEEQRQRAEEAKKRAEEQRAQAEAEADHEAKESAEQFVQSAPACEPTKQDNKVYKCTFTVYATKQQLAELKRVMKEKGIRYE